MLMITVRYDDGPPEGAHRDTPEQPMTNATHTHTDILATTEYTGGLVCNQIGL